MKKIFVLPAVLLSIVLLGCELIPDLNPNTNAGADITVFDVNDTLFLNSYPTYPYPKYDFNNDGINELEFDVWGGGIVSGVPKSFIVRVNGDILVLSIPEPYGFYYAVSLSNNNSSTNLLSNFTNEGIIVNGRYYYAPLGGNTDWYWAISNGLKKYLMVRIILGGKHHYGWIEYSSNYNLEDETGAIVFKRFGVSNEAGKVIRAGQTE
ncbi:MAG: hypothetical protein KDD32_06475 [Bacteroidetes bacterium]|nr:hypothetical protein [Bacteroidota bacterium]